MDRESDGLHGKGIYFKRDGYAYQIIFSQFTVGKWQLAGRSNIPYRFDIHHN
jgi:hypothetical protein